MDRDKKFLLGLCGAVIAIGLMARGCASKPTRPSGSGPSVGAESSYQPDHASVATAAVPSEETEKRLAQLAPHFNVKTDEFDKTVRVLHKSYRPFMNGNGTTLVAEIDNHTFNLCSQYVASDWIFHDEVIVKAGTNVVSASGRRRDEVVDGVVEELCLKPGDSLAIARLIQGAGATPVRIRLTGKYNKDYTLKPASQKAIAETVEYFDLKNN